MTDPLLPPPASHPDPVVPAPDLDPATEAELARFRDAFKLLKETLGQVIVGQHAIIDHCLTAMVAGGHVLLEGVPGLGKTLLVKTIADALHLKFGRVQFTPDLMPADLVGTRIFIDDGKGAARFEFSRGPLFCNLLLGDEINRATPKTQSALLEAMQEKSVTTGGETHRLEAPFFVLATQNPLEQEGTYPLPEAQLDRFFFRLVVPYPSFAEFENILARTTGATTARVQPVFDGAELVRMGQLARRVPIPDTVRRRTVELVMGTHPETEYASPGLKRYARYGASPRAGQACLLAAQVRAVLAGRYHVATEDVIAVAPAVLNHRVILNFEAQADGVNIDQLLAELIKTRQAAWSV
ncbi:AAA family ATPase [Rariglobus hedericola]|uniref:MoxR family ATPase n=1 Tax=Rariglobus hedericola TaxID=2597822 RepID=A0A556QKN1_9BACT|nr:MoxR family ATPase [Rariglobus hedericola]TSJ77177.1 MoxR family ATPase [Rariglobus hedericola]